MDDKQRVVVMARLGRFYPAAQVGLKRPSKDISLTAKPIFTVPNLIRKPQPMKFKKTVYLNSEPKQSWQVKQPERNWLELPSGIMVNILQRVGVDDILHNAQKVCTAWHEIYKDPAMRRNLGFVSSIRSSQLRHLELVYYVSTIDGIMSTEAFKKLSSLEELSLVRTMIKKVNIEDVGRYCPLLKTLKLNEEGFRLRELVMDGADVQNEIALAIAENLPQLTHLELIGNCIQNIG
ncbi:putative F-box/LRR-repeat protein 23 [Bidens hawaiensis]|uniref:putative F-box/LRR-repeat protein 23 n=1 Tax=Bidens hawaiensis TaxID=980011 RepID=UPI00404B45DE